MEQTPPEFMPDLFVFSFGPSGVVEIKGNQREKIQAGKRDIFMRIDPSRGFPAKSGLNRDFEYFSSMFSNVIQTHLSLPYRLF